MKAYVNRITTAVPPYDIHQRFSNFAPGFLNDPRERVVFKRMADRSQISHRYSFLQPDAAGRALDGNNFYCHGAFPDTTKRMQFYQDTAFTLAREALDKLDLPMVRSEITHVIVTSCTGFYAPGLDLQIVEHYGLKYGVERSIIGFMGCYAAFNGLKLARHIVRSAPDAKVLLVNLELCTLHLQATANIEQLLSYLIFADGCAASIVSAQPFGIALESFCSTIVPESREQITWGIGNDGFDMVLSGAVPATITDAIPALRNVILNGHNTQDVMHWAIHPGGRSILDAVQKSFALPDEALQPSRKILRDYGNMSSATVMFVLKDMLEMRTGLGCAMAFGPGVTLESMLFHVCHA